MTLIGKIAEFFSALFGIAATQADNSAVSTSSEQAEPSADPPIPMDSMIEAYWREYVQGKHEARETVKALDEDKICAGITKRVNDGTFRLIEIPANILRAMELIRSENFNYCNLEEHLQNSPAMATEIIRIANTTAFRRKKSAATLRDAMARLGKRTLLSVLYFGTTRSFVAGKKHLEPITESIVDHSYAVATISRYMAARYGFDPEEAFLAGLLHDIGKIAIVSDVADNADIPYMHKYASEYFYEDILNPLHEYIGGIIVAGWDVKPEIALAISSHHQIQVIADDKITEQHRLAALINFCDIVARVLGKGRWIDEQNLLSLRSAALIGIADTNDNIAYINDILLLFDDTRDMLDPAT